MKKILLINPRAETSFAGFTFNEPLVLGVLSALTPFNYEIEIIDENFERFNELIKCDLVAITCSMTTAINRAYTISAKYIEQNIPTVIGGMHASFFPEEASRYFTTVVIGDAEPVWKKILSDFESNNLQKFYGEIEPQKRYIITPKRDVFKKYPYVCASVETSRGCNQICDYCSVASLYMHKHCERSIDDIIEDIKTVADKVIFFTDDNFIGNFNNKQRTITILERIIPLHIKWAGFCTLDIVNHPDLLNLFKESGCILLFTGLETDESSTLNSIKKSINLNVLSQNKLKECVDAVHRFGIALMGFQIFGFDTDTSIKNMHLRLKRLNKSGLDWFVIFSLTPIPGSRIRKRLEKENRIIYSNYPEDWELYNFTKAVFIPKNFSPEALDEFFIRTNNYYYNRRNTLYRIIRTYFKTGSLKNTLYMFVWITHNWINIKHYWYTKYLLLLARHVLK